MRQYQAIVDHVVPAITAKETLERPEPGPAWSPHRAEEALFERIARDERSTGAQVETENQTKKSNGAPRVFRFGSEATWRRVWLLYAAAILLSIALGISAYRVGIRHGIGTAKVMPPQPDTRQQLALEERLSDAGHEREMARAQ